MKKKAQRFHQFIDSANSVNYRDKAVIVEHFNNSVRLYKRFQDIYDGGDEKLAAIKLRDAGTNLYQSCEWMLKNYLHKSYEELYTLEKITLSERTQKVDQLSRRDTNLFVLLKEFENYSIPNYQQFGIRTKDILDNAGVTNNNPKHNATIPNPNQYKKALGEIRKMIKSYIDENAKLDLLEDTIYGEEKGWYEILEDTNDFSKSYSYILVTKRIEEANLKGLFSIKWDLIIDLDSSSDINGLAFKYKAITGVNPWIRMLNNIDSKRKYSYSQIPYWIMANGNSDNPDTIVEVSKWKNRYGRFLDDTLEKFHSVYSKPAKVFIYPIENEKNVEKIVESFDDIYDEGETVDLFVLSPEYEYSRIDGINFRKSPVSINDFCDNLLVHHEGDLFLAESNKKEVPDEEGNRIALDESFFIELQDSFEVVYFDIAKTEENDVTKTSRSEFYRGCKEISWYGIRENFDVIRYEKDLIKEKIVLDMSDRGRLLRKVCYEPGMGGTTLLRRLAYELRAKYPTVILQKCNEQTAKNLQKLYDIAHSPVLIFADNNNIEVEEVQNLQIELKRMGFAFVICHFERKLQGKKPTEGSIYTVVPALRVNEASEMQNKLSDFISDESIKQRLKQILDNKKLNERSPFIMSMYVFDKDFKGIKPYINNFLAHMNSQTKKLVFALSLADYGNVPMDIEYFTELFADNLITDFLFEEVPGINELAKIEHINGKEFIRIRYHLFAIEVLRQISLGKDSEEISFLALLDNLLTFIADSRKNMYIVNQDTLNVLRNLFITRTADTDAEKPAFSPLITKLQEEHKTHSTGKYDGSNDAIIRIFNKLVEIYPEESHFTAHLARYYFYIDKNFEKGFSNIDSAIELSETMNGVVDPLLYHMKAMGYSAQITNEHIKLVYKNIRDGLEEENKLVFSKIEEDSRKASSLFEKVRDSNIGVAGHVSEINLCIQIANMAKNIIEESEEFCKYIISDNGKWAMNYVDRATDLWDECKKIAVESNFDNLNDIETRLYQLTANLDQSIELWEEYLIGAEGKEKLQARRLLARAYERQNTLVNNRVNIQNNLQKIIQLMEDNMAEESKHSGNIRIWFEAIKKIQIDNQDSLIMDAVIKLNRWVSLTDSVEAHYYRFILKFIQAIEGSSLAEGELPKLLREMKMKSINLYNRTAAQHWLTNTGNGLDALISDSRNKKDAIPEDEMSSKMKILVGRISNNYVNESHAYINYRGVEVYFNPSVTKGEIGRSNINQRVKFGIGFSYDGPRAYNSSIKLLGKDDHIEESKQLELGTIVKCEVIKNVTYYTQVRIIGYEEMGSIHVQELQLPYSEKKRPELGSVLDAKILNQKFDNMTQRNMWMLTMNNVEGVKKGADIEVTEFAKALRKLDFKL